jgi:hypothetical protein
VLKTTDRDMFARLTKNAGKSPMDEDLAELTKKPPSPKPEDHAEKLAIVA